MPINPTTVHQHLTQLLKQRSLDAALAFFDALGYGYGDELPLPTRTWAEGAWKMRLDHEGLERGRDRREARKGKVSDGEGVSFRGICDLDVLMERQ